MARLSEKEVRDLQSGAKHPNGVVRESGTGFDRINCRKRLEKLVRAGLIEPNPHGDFYITDAGRAAITAAEGQEG